MTEEQTQHSTQKLLLLLKEKEDEIDRLKQIIASSTQAQNETSMSTNISPSDELTKEEVLRYGRQLILPIVGAEGQKRLRNSSVLIIGAGGLGCPAAIYLAGAGIGRLGIVDFDTVDLSNLHRQILHHEAAVGMSKSSSVGRAIRYLNSGVQVNVHHLQLDNSNALSIVSGYDVVVDCSDNPSTRYLVNDACVLAKKPLVSGSALRLEGQLTVYNHQGGPCYRCLFPVPPDAKFVTNCSDGGVLGPGTLQAMEAIKLAVGACPSYSRRLLIFDGESGTFRLVNLRPKQAACVVCGDARTIVNLEDVDYTLFCGRGPTDKEVGLEVLDCCDRVTALEFQKVSRTKEGFPYLLIDVRPQLETAICRLPVPSLNVPYEELDDRADHVRDAVRRNLPFSGDLLPIYVVCRRGNNSQLAVNKLKNYLSDWPVVVKDIVRGLVGWTEEVDPQFPIY